MNTEYIYYYQGERWNMHNTPVRKYESAIRKAIFRRKAREFFEDYIAFPIFMILFLALWSLLVIAFG